MPSNLRRQGNMAARIDRAVQEYADGKSAHANNVTTLVGSNDKRMRVGDFRVIFIETEDLITVVRIGPRGGIYE